MSKLPSLGPSLTHHLVENQRQMVRRANSSAFTLSGTSVTAEGETTVDGTLAVTGNLEVSGHAAITGTLSLPSGIIGNDALTSPVVPQSVNFGSSNFAITTTSAVKTTQTITVPAGFTTAVVTVLARVHAINPNTTGGLNSTGADGIYITAQIDTVAGNAHGDVILGSSSSGITVDGLSTVLPGLTGGGTFTIVVNAYTQMLTWAANAANAAEISGSILWLR